MVNSILLILTSLTAPADYSLVNTSVTFPSGSTAGGPPQCIDLSIVNDDSVEYDEEFAIMLSPMNEFIIINGDTVTVTILDNDGK